MGDVGLVKGRVYPRVKDGFDWKNPRGSKIKRPLALHGTSSLLVEQIMREGMSFKCPLLTREELETVGDFFISKTFDPFNSSHTHHIQARKKGELYERWERISLSASTHIAIDHATKGPEILTRILGAPTGKELLPEVKRIIDKIKDFFAGHKPVVLLVDTPFFTVDLEIVERARIIWENIDHMEIREFTDTQLAGLRREEFPFEEALEFYFREVGKYSYVIADERLTFVPPEAIKGVVELNDELLREIGGEK